MSKGKILVAPLNWGLGHATRCIPVINALIEENYTPVIASDGDALKLLRTEFPDLEYYELPSLNINYAKHGFMQVINLALQSYKLFKCIRQEQQFIKDLAKKVKLKGIIADNRLGLYHKEIPCVVMTHQVKVYSGRSTWLTSTVHQLFLKKYDECWVPDNKEKPYLSGRLAHVGRTSIKLRYIGLLSRFNIKKRSKKYEVLILISGPETQRSIFENIMIDEFKNYHGKVALVQGKLEQEKKEFENGHIKVFNYLNSEELENIIQESEIIVARSGYTTLMDMAKLNKKAIFIPTPGQVEQQYLAKSLKKHGLAPYCQQRKFNLNIVGDAKLYDGLGEIFSHSDGLLKQALLFFQSE